MSKHYKNTRNSSIELLRIIATYLIILRHFVVFNTFDVWSQTLSIKKVVLEGIFYPSGKIGVVLFSLSQRGFFVNHPQVSRQVSKDSGSLSAKFFSTASHSSYSFVFSNMRK